MTLPVSFRHALLGLSLCAAIAPTALAQNATAPTSAAATAASATPAPAASSNTTTPPAVSASSTAAPAALLPHATLPAASAAKPTPQSVLALMTKVADWQLANPSREPKNGWVNAAFYAGAMAFAPLSPDKKYYDAMLAMGDQNAWKPAARVYMADDHAVGQTYLELYEIYQKPEMLAPIRERFDVVMAAPKDDVLDFSKPNATDRWSWCDALFMAPPAWARLAKITGEKKYLDFANRLWWVTSDYLYDKEEHLYYRDSRFFPQREPNGKKLFWSRGNGWVMGGLVRMLQYLPKDYPDRPKYIQQLKEMAAKMKEIQQPDGLWRPGLLDAAAHPQLETSGTGFDTYAIAWAVNEGILDRATYEPVVFKAWNALAQCVEPDGKLVHVQPVGDQAKDFADNSTVPYGPGSFLLAGSEVFRLVGGQKPAVKSL